MKSMLYYLCQQQPPKNLEIQIIDMKGGATFSPFTRLPHVRSVAKDSTEALEMLAYCATEMWERLEQVRIARKHFQPDPKFRMIVLVIDEGGELSPADAIGDEKKLRETCMDALSTLARVGREPGIRIIYGTQRPDRYTLPMTIRSQLENTLCFRVSEDYDSKIVLGREGAELLPQIPGRMIYKTPADQQIVQGVCVPDEVLNAWLSRYMDSEDMVEMVRGSASTLSAGDVPNFLR
jgi:DNA segregation ATPase FtsK/SpoIIIE-like protein